MKYSRLSFFFNFLQFQLLLCIFYYRPSLSIALLKKFSRQDGYSTFIPFLGFGKNLFSAFSTPFLPFQYFSQPSTTPPTSIHHILTRFITLQSVLSFSPHCSAFYRNTKLFRIFQHILPLSTTLHSPLDNYTFFQYDRSVFTTFSSFFNTFRHFSQLPWLLSRTPRHSITFQRTSLHSITIYHISALISSIQILPELQTAIKNHFTSFHHYYHHHLFHNFI